MKFLLRNPRKTAAEQSAPLPRPSVPVPASGRAFATFALLKFRESLSVKIILLAALNLILLVCLIVGFIRLAFRVDVGALLLSPTRDRVLSVSRLIALDLPNHPQADWDKVLERFSVTYPAHFTLFNQSGRRLAGASAELPDNMLVFVKSGPGNFHGPPFGHRGEHPRPRDPFAEFRATHSGGRYFLASHVPIWERPGEPPTSCTLVWSFSSLWTNTFYFDYRPWLLLVFAVGVVFVLCWGPLIRGLTHSISAITAATAQIAEGHFEVSLAVRRRDELGALSHSINRMAERLSSYVHGQKRFLSDVAHELCSPIARTQMALGILRQRADEHSLPYVEDVEEEVAHMSGLINELLSFSKAEIHSPVRELTRVSVAETVKSVLAREGGGGVAIENRCPEAVAVIAEPDYLFRSLANLVRNAIRYASHDGPIEISATASGRDIVIAVADCGPGVPESYLDEIFKPFYRPELARQRETGGSGLGLAIVKSCVEACGGAVQCRNRQPRGLLVEIRLPAAV